MSGASRRALAVVAALALPCLVALGGPASAAATAPRSWAAATRTLPTETTVPSSWVRWEGKYFTAWRPAKSWPVVETTNGIDVSSPTGTGMASFAYATNLPSAWTPDQVRRLMLSPNVGFSNTRILQRSRVISFSGGTAQQFLFTAVRKYDRATVKGLLTAYAYAGNWGAYGLSATVMHAPVKVWPKWVKTLTIIRDHITFYGTGAPDMAPVDGPIG